jgi:hypothetical protein
MAIPNLKLPTANQVFRTILADDRGQPILDISAGEYMVHEPDGSITIRKENHSILLMDGLEWNPAMAAAIRIGCCELCRNPPRGLFSRERPRHGLVSMAKAKRCAECGLLLCPRHRHRGADERWRCPACGRSRRLRDLVLDIFFSREE